MPYAHFYCFLRFYWAVFFFSFCWLLVWFFLNSIKQSSFVDHMTFTRKLWQTKLSRCKDASLQRYAFHPSLVGFWEKQQCHVSLFTFWLLLINTSIPSGKQCCELPLNWQGQGAYVCTVLPSHIWQMAEQTVGGSIKLHQLSLQGLRYTPMREKSSWRCFSS